MHFWKFARGRLPAFIPAAVIASIVVAAAIVLGIFFMCFGLPLFSGPNDGAFRSDATTNVDESVGAETNTALGLNDDLYDIDFTIDKEEFVIDEKRAIYVTLHNKISEEDLRKLALRLHRERQGEFKRTFISYRLPLMDRYWARTDFKPDLQVKIFGLTVEEEAKVKAEVVKTPGRIIGHWSDEGLGEVYTLYSIDGSTFYRTTFRDCGSLTFELSPRIDGRRFDKTKSTNGDYLYMHADGTLRIGDIEGEYTTLIPISF